MNKYTFELELVQIEELLSKSRSNKFSDSRLNKFFNELNLTFNAILNSDYEKFDIAEQEEHRLIFHFILNGLEFLDTSTLNLIPFEQVFCLHHALRDWVVSDDLIIVTSLSNRKDDIWFEGWREETIRNTKDLIKSKYGLDISFRLIRISLPKALARDYLSGVVLYHELGHFVDAELNITERIFFERFGFNSDNICTDEQYYFYHYQMEYFADLFAAQYINDSSAIYLNHLAYNHGDSEQHPSTKKRDEVVKKFLKGESTLEIDLIQNALSKAGLDPLKIRHETIEVSTSDFSKLIPQNIENVQKLHSIYKLGWDLWLNSDKNFLKDFTRRQKYYVINNLIEKTISNYNVIQTWENFQKKV